MQILLKQGSEQKSLVPRTAWILLPSLLPATLVAASVTSGFEQAESDLGMLEVF